MEEFVKKEKSCGCIIVEEGKVLLVEQTAGHWGLPKGHVEENETEKETAIREVKEETNLDVEIISDKRFVEAYMTDRGTYKEVVYFLAKKIGGEIKNQEEEVKSIEWLSVEEAIEKISFDNMKELLKKALI